MFCMWLCLFGSKKEKQRQRRQADCCGPGARGRQEQRGEEQQARGARLAAPPRGVQAGSVLLPAHTLPWVLLQRRQQHQSLAAVRVLIAASAL